MASNLKVWYRVYADKRLHSINVDTDKSLVHSAGPYYFLSSSYAYSYMVSYSLAEVRYSLIVSGVYELLINAYLPSSNPASKLKIYLTGPQQPSYLNWDIVFYKPLTETWSTFNIANALFCVYPMNPVLIYLTPARCA